MRPSLDRSSSSSSSSFYQTSQFFGQRGSSSDSSSRSSAEANDTEERSTRMLTRSRSPASHPLHTIYTDEENNSSPEKSSADQEYEHAQRRLTTLKYAVNELNHAGQFDLEKAQELFNKIKSAEAALKLLAREGSDEDVDMLLQFANGMAVCLNNFARFLSIGKPLVSRLQYEGTTIPANSQLATLEAYDVHELCNGLSTLFEDSLRSTLFSKDQLKHLTKPLRDINQALIVQAMLKGLPTDLPSNACLLDILNLQSRLLKAKLLPEDSKAIRALFARSLAIIEQWPAESGVPVTEAGKVVSRQLAKTLVQLNTIKSFNLIKLDKSPAGKTNRERLGQCVLALCTKLALEEFTLKRNPEKPADEPLRVQPRGVEVSNISNTIKDFIEAGYLSLNSAESYALVERIAGLIIQIPQADMQQRTGQTLSNCGNFLRTVLESAMRPQSSKTILQSAAYQAACNFLLTRIASDIFWSTMSWGSKADQTLANSASFLKAMVKAGKADVTLLQSATSVLIRQIQHYGAENITEAQSVSGLLSALISIAYLAPRAPVPALIEQLLDTVAKQVHGKWPSKSRAVALRAALTWLAEGRNLQANPAIDALLKAGVFHDDALPYLQAIRLRVKDNADRLKEFQLMLHQLLADWINQSDDITLDDIEQAIKRLESKEPVSPPRLTIVPVAMSLTTHNEAAKPVEPPIPGLTPIKPTTTTSASNHFTASTSSSSVKPVPSNRNADHSDETWEEPANILGNKTKEARREQTLNSATVHSSTNPVVTTRAPQTEKKSAKPAADTNASKAKKITNVPPNKQASTTPNVITAKPKATTTMARQWFEAIQNKGMKNRMKVLEQLAQQYPEVIELQDGNGNNGRTALFHALMLGDQALVEWLLLRMQPMSDIAATSLLRLIFMQPILVDDAMKMAMTTLLQKLETNQSEVIAMIFNKHPKLIPQAYRAILLQFKPAGSIAEVTASTTTTLVRNEAKKIRRAQDVRRDREREEERVAATSDMREAEAEEIKLLKKIEKSVNKAKSRNPLLAALFYGDIDAINTLLDTPKAAAMFWDTEHHYGLTPLLISILRKQDAIAERLLQTDAGKASATITGKNGHSPLMRALLGNQDYIARLLISLPNIVEQAKLRAPENSVNALLLAVKNKKYDLVRLLVGVRGAEDQALQLYFNGGNALHEAMAEDDPIMMEILLTMPNGREQFNQLGVYKQHLLFESAASKNQINIINLLLKYEGAEEWIFLSPGAGPNMLSQAISCNFHELAESLLNSPHGERLSVLKRISHNIPLMVAAAQGEERIATRLLTMSTATQQAMCTNEVGENALMLATKKGRIGIVKGLIALPNAADQTCQRHKPAAPHEKFKIVNRDQLYNSIDQYKFEWSVLRKLAENKGMTTQQYLASRQVLEPKNIDTTGMNAWQIAMAKGYAEIAALLLPFEQS